MSDKYRLIVTYTSSTSDKTYDVKLNLSTGRLTCNCPTWIFNRRKDRTCNHTDRVYQEENIDTILLGRV